MKLNPIPSIRIAYISLVASLLLYFAYCQNNGHGLLYFTRPAQQTWSPQGSAGVHHK